MSEQERCVRCGGDLFTFGWPEKHGHTGIVAYHTNDGWLCEGCNAKQMSGTFARGCDLADLTLDDFSPTCDWGNCDEPTVGLRPDNGSERGELLPVCRKHICDNDVNEPVERVGGAPERTENVQAPSGHAPESSRSAGVDVGNEHFENLLTEALEAACAHGMAVIGRRSNEHGQWMTEKVSALRLYVARLEREIDRLRERLSWSGDF